MDKPELDITDIPVTPPAPTFELPELEIPEVPAEPNDKPKVDFVEDKPSVKEVNNELPKTGSKDDGILMNIAFGILFIIACIKAYFTKKN